MYNNCFSIHFPSDSEVIQSSLNVKLLRDIFWKRALVRTIGTQFRQEAGRRTGDSTLKRVRATCSTPRYKTDLSCFFH